MSRYASQEMLYIFSPENKFVTWRKLWVALAQAEKKLGLPISERQIKELQKHIYDINYKVAENRERETRHDVMSHVYAYGKQCPAAAGIIHLGATSAYVGDNTDLIQMRDAALLVKSRLLAVVKRLSSFAEKYKSLPTLAFTHFQPAQLTTVGKRASLWIQDLMLDLHDLDHRIENIAFLGVKGTTGTQASFVELFNGDGKKVMALDREVTKLMGFSRSFAVAGQTYPRKIDARFLSVLSGIAQSAHKMTNDIRLLQNLKEVEEPFGKKQIGSSAMAYKRNPMRSERVASLARLIMAFSHSVEHTAATQWFERTLDDSANKRISVSEAFLATDSVLLILADICDGLVVYPKMVERHITAELPFMATENILMEAVKRGGDRQELHERIRIHSMEAGKRVKTEGVENDLLDRIANDSHFNISKVDLGNVLKPKNFIGRAPEQVTVFLREEVYPYLKKNSSLIKAEKIALKV